MVALELSPLEPLEVKLITTSSDPSKLSTINSKTALFPLSVLVTYDPFGFDISFVGKFTTLLYDALKVVEPPIV